MAPKITWFDHASFMLEGEKRVYIDPWEIPAGPPADVVLISHDHFDHCVPEDVAKVATDQTVIVAPPDCVTKLAGYRVTTLAPGQQLTVEGLTVEGVAAYNPAKEFHPRDNCWLGFVVSLDGQRIYYVGDSDVTPEMKAVQADIVMVPVGGTYTMTAEEAAAAVNEMGTPQAIPYHWGKIVGSEEDAQRFAQLCRAEVLVLDKAAPHPKV